MKITKDDLLYLQDIVNAFDEAGELLITEQMDEVNTKSNHYAFLEHLFFKFRPKKALEIGTHLGVSALSMHDGCPETLLWTIDNNLINSPDIGKFAKGLNNVTFILGNAKDVVDQIPNDLEIIFVDEEKDVEALQSNLDLYYPKLLPGGVMLFDDVLGKDYYPEAYEWWVNLKGYNKLDLPLVHKGYAIGAILK